MKYARWLLVFTLLFSLIGCKHRQEQPMEYGIVVQLDKAWMPRNLLEYPFTRWTYMFKLDGRKVMPPRRFGFSNGTGVFSSDWQWLAYRNMWNDRVYVMRMSDGRKTRISNETLGGNLIRWVNNHTLAYGASGKVYIQDISCLPISGRLSSKCLPSPIVIDIGGTSQSEFWDISPNGEKILYIRYKYENFVPVEAQRYLMVVGKPPMALSEDNIIIGFVDDTKVLIVASEELRIGEIDENGQILQKALITSIDETDGGFAFSPDKKYIAFASSREEYGLGHDINPYPGEFHPTASALFVMDLSSGDVHRLTYPDDHDVLWFGWYPLR
ncbi:MAG: hypothetical protein ACUVRJ_09450 [Candidatus Villigracilaceae bacterium]